VEDWAKDDLALERKRAEEALSASEAKYRRLFETARDGILILDGYSGLITDVNPFLISLLD
jgi:PAS domain-containing protein